MENIAILVILISGLEIMICSVNFGLLSCMVDFNISLVTTIFIRIINKTHVYKITYN